MKTKLLTGFMAAALAGYALAAPAPPTNTGYYVVVPLQARAFEAAAGIGVSLSGAALPSGLLGIPYPGYNFQNLLVVTGDETYTGYGVHWSILDGALPAGLTLNADGTVSGTPTANGTSAFTVRANYKTKDGDQAYQLFVGKITIDIDAATPPQAIVGQAYSYDLKPLLQVNGDSSYAGTGVSWSVVSSTLPAGMALRTDGTISGTPTAGGTGTVIARASYRGSNGEQSYTIITLAINVGLAAGSPPQAIVGQVYSYDLSQHLAVSGDQAYTGGQVTWSTVSNTLAPGLVLGSNGVINGTPTAAGTGNLIARATYRGVDGQQTYQVVTLGINVNLATATLPQAIVGQAFSYDLKSQLNVTGDNAYDGSGVTWSVVSSTLPSGIVLRTNGTISGTPTSSGTGTITARATYRGVNGEQTYQLVTLGINVALSAATPPQAIVGQAYSYDLKPLLNVTGDSAYDISSVTWSVVGNTLPAGLSLLNNGTIAGTPTGGGTGSVTVRATYRGVNGQLSYQVVSLPITVSLASATPPGARVGESYSYDIKPLVNVTGDASYALANVSYSVVANTLPSGLYLTAGGVISGTPTTATAGSLTARATYRAVNGEQTYSISAAPAWVYTWTPGGWNTPSACGSTTSSRSVTCVRDDGATVADAYCTGGKPATTQASTNYASCEYTLRYSGWSGCSASCGGGSQSRSFTCERSDGTTVANGNCGTPDALSQACNTQSCYSYGWVADDWSNPGGCGTVTESRAVYCQRSDGATVSSTYCGGGKPATSQSTTNVCTYSANLGDWGSCSKSCGGGTQSRSVSCTRSDGTTAANSLCGSPATSQSCNTQACAYTYGYSYGEWSTPSGCGTVTQTRSATCIRSDGATVSNSFCGAAVTSQSTTNVCTYSANIGDWGSCSKSCGGGTQSRSVSCTRSDGTAVVNSYCGSPATSQSCNTQACAPVTGTWSAGAYVGGGCGNAQFAFDEPLSGSCSPKGATNAYSSYVGQCSNGVGEDTNANNYVQTCR